MATIPALVLLLVDVVDFSLSPSSSSPLDGDREEADDITPLSLFPLSEVFPVDRPRVLPPPSLSASPPSEEIDDDLGMFDNSISVDDDDDDDDDDDGLLVDFLDLLLFSPLSCPDEVLESP